MQRDSGSPMVAEDVSKRFVCSEDYVRERFDELMARVGRGETVAITREGRVVAELSPQSEPEFDREQAKAAVAKFREERARLGPINATIEELMAWRHEGHRL